MAMDHPPSQQRQHQHRQHQHQHQQPFVPPEGSIEKGQVTRVEPYGAFVQLLNYRARGLVHISHLASYKVDKVEDAVNVNDEVWVKVLQVEQQPHPDDSNKMRHKISLSLKYASQDGTKRDLESEQQEKAGNVQELQNSLTGTIGMGIALDPMAAFQKIGGGSNSSRIVLKQNRNKRQTIINGYALVDDTEGEPEPSLLMMPDNDTREPSASCGIQPLAAPTAPPMGRGRGSTLPAWMTRGKEPQQEGPTCSRGRGEVDNVRRDNRRDHDNDDKDDNHSINSKNSRRRKKRKHEKKKSKEHKEPSEENDHGRRRRKKRDRKHHRHHPSSRNDNDDKDNDQDSHSDTDDNSEHDRKHRRHRYRSSRSRRHRSDGKNNDPGNTDDSAGSESDEKKDRKSAHRHRSASTRSGKDRYDNPKEDRNNRHHRSSSSRHRHRRNRSRDSISDDGEGSSASGGNARSCNSGQESSRFASVEEAKQLIADLEQRQRKGCK